MVQMVYNKSRISRYKISRQLTHHTIRCAQLYIWDSSRIYISKPGTTPFLMKNGYWPLTVR